MTLGRWGSAKNCTFADNTDDWALNHLSSEPSYGAYNSVFDGANPNGSVESDVPVSSSLLPGAPLGDGNIDGAPTFVDAASGDYRLAEGSLGIDAANGDYYSGGAVDLGGDDRLFDEPCTPDTGNGKFTHLDMGAYEFQGNGNCDGDGVADDDEVCQGFDDNVDTHSDTIPDGCDACAGGAASGDADANGIVGLGDHADLESCLLGPGEGLGTGCECFDFDFDGDVDLEDVGAFTSAFGS